VLDEYTFDPIVDVDIVDESTEVEEIRVGPALTIDDVEDIPLPPELMLDEE